MLISALSPHVITNPQHALIYNSHTTAFTIEYLFSQQLTHIMFISHFFNFIAHSHVVYHIVYDFVTLSWPLD